MARIRSVHPGLFTDEAWMGLSPMARVFLIGLWTEADDNGLFEWKPITLKVRLLPADNVDVGALLNELAMAGCLKRFEADGASFGAIRNFCRWQRPERPAPIHNLPPEIAPYVAHGAKGRGRPKVASPPKLEVLQGGRTRNTDAAPKEHRKSTAQTVFQQCSNTDGEERREEEKNLPPIPPYPGEILREGVAAVASDPRPRPGVRVPRPRDWERELIGMGTSTCARTGEVRRVRVCGPVVWDYAVEHTRAILGWPEDYAVDWEPLARWCAAGLEWEPDLEPEFRAATGRMGDTPINSLRFFEKAMQIRIAQKAGRLQAEMAKREARARKEEQDLAETRRAVAEARAKDPDYDKWAI